MKIWLLTNTEGSYDDGLFENAVVTAETEEDAKKVSLMPPGVPPTTNREWPTDLGLILAQYLGEAKPDLESKCILASWIEES